jgi:hypothetical protein
MSKTTATLAAAATVVLSVIGAASASADVVMRQTVAVRTAVLRPAFVRPHVPPRVTGGEAARIRYQIHEHHQLQRMAAADGVVTRREQARLNHDAAQVRHLIHVAKTN